ncbi:mediterrocin family bacteriocin [[Clostridium] polysaccharolyticum]|uniref:Bacteriocin (Lactococcin_972) n=1 Tax=[Clostridium] polysaccharolyticum TaxID=29364 RepID=A0A1I0FE48_9FIRM|nr:hypothetical protein [[Clostridium] polysaccharolyticum]SET56154.1 hypothetical protein SAMN04487772_13029 [[Clostridium] polysaccharolyticum]
MRISLKKGIALALTGVAVSGLFFGGESVLITAGSIEASASSFSKPWERYKSGDNDNAELTYGYNTWAIDEDYAWAKHNTKSHYASLKNGTGWHTGSGKGAGSLSRVDVTHSGSSVSYYNNY